MKTNKLYMMRLQDHMQMLKRRRSATNAAITRKGITTERIGTVRDLSEHIAFMQRWISEVKRG